MASSDFLAKIKLSLEGKEQVVSGLQQTQAAAQQLSKTKVTTIFDEKGIATGKQVEETFKVLNDKVGKSRGLMKEFGNAMKRALIVAPAWMIMRGVIQAVTQTISDQLKFLIDLETAMVRIKIVGKGTAEEYKSLQSALIGLAYSYGTTASEAAQAAVIFAQQGRTVKETVELTRAAMLASKILGTDIKTAIDDMTAAIEGFKLGIGDATSVVDKWINVEKQFAVTSKDLADATKVAGASAHQLGITMSEFLGDVTAVVEVTRKSGSEAARGLSFIYARLLTSGQKTVEQITKIPFYLNATGEATTVLGTQLRSISDILEELAGKWENLTTKEKLDIATSLGSKRQMVILNALMQNYTASLDARIAALTSAGAAEKAFALIQDTTEIKLKQVSAAWNVLTEAVANTSGFKTSLSLFDKMIINFTALINYEKAYGALYAREINTAQLANETRLNEVNSLEELLSVREKLSKAPQTIENIDRLKKVQDAITSISRKEPKIKVVLETGTPEEFKKAIETRLQEINKEKIRLNVSLEFEPKIAGVEEKIKDLQTELAWTGGERAIELRGKISDKEKEISSLYGEQNRILNDQYKIYLGQEAARKKIEESTQLEQSMSTQLTDSELERIANEGILNNLKSQGVLTSRQLLEVELNLVKNSEFLYGTREKNKKILELEMQIQASRITESNKLVDREVEILKLRGLSSQSLLEAETTLREMITGQDTIRSTVDYQYDKQKALTEEALKMIDNELELARIRGTSGLELVKAKEQLMGQVFGTEAIRNNLDLRLEREREVTKELYNQNKLSSDSIELYKIAIRYGSNIASIFSQVLQGQRDIASLNTKEQGIFKRFFSSQFTQMQALKFFQSGQGGGVSIPELQGVNTRNINIPGLTQERLPVAISNIKNTIPIEIAPMNINVNIDSEIVMERIKEEIIKELDDRESELSKTIDEKIDEF